MRLVLALSSRQLKRKLQREGVSEQWGLTGWYNRWERGASAQRYGMAAFADVCCELTWCSVRFKVVVSVRAYSSFFSEPWYFSDSAIARPLSGLMCVLYRFRFVSDLFFLSASAITLPPS